ncbi:hypothetical protein BD413DRAFT_647290 [Trametes elegans]|nr:hypothetical protein BD413DRAFT_647290 [Trametes elegans]
MDADLPQYSRTSTTASISTTGSRTARPLAERVYHLTSSNGTPWLTLTMSCRTPAPNSLPLFRQDEAIQGSVILSLEKSEPIISVFVELKGQIASSTTDVRNFVRVPQALWICPRQAGVTSAGKITGLHKWPFSLRFPTHCELKAPDGTVQSYPLPASFSERLARVHIQYQVIVTVHRSRFRMDSTLSTVVGYCPIIRPDAPSPLRQIAYLEGTPLIGPDGDPDGWKRLEPLRIHGSLFSTRDVEASCTVRLHAMRVCYTRGSVIPCLMTIQAADPHALDLLSAPRSPLVRLLRRISTQEAPTAGSVSRRKLPRIEFQSTVQEMATAVWWPEPGDSPKSPQKRTLHGEIHLAPGLTPSCSLGKFELSYSVAVYPPRAVAFTPRAGADAVLQREPVVVGTAYATGPRPRVHSPPGYDDASSSGRASEFCLFR